MTFRVGQKVVCIRGSHDRADHVRLAGAQHVFESTIYTIRDLVLSNPHHRPAVLLEEVVNPLSLIWGTEYCFDITRFRPLIERKTDISIFTRMLNPSQVDA